MDNQQSAEELGQRRMPCWQSKITGRTVWLSLMWVCVCVLACSSTTSHGGELVINKILANSSVAVLPGRIAPVDWAELRNRSDQELDISGMGLSDRLDLPDRWVFPPGSIVRAREAIIVIFTDSIPPSTSPVPYMNTGFGLSAGGDVLLLSSVSGGLWTTEDSVGFGFQAQDWPIGRVPDGTGSWQLVELAPKELNRAVALGYPSALRINEWMADPSSGDDWFEICNLAAAPVAVGGLYLSDDRKLPTRHRIPDLSFIGTGEYGFGLFEADGDVSKGARHVGFKLGKKGSPILLTAADGRQLLDQVIYGPQLTGISGGRFPDGASTFNTFPGTSTPGAPNFKELQGIVLSEVLSHSDDPYEDSFEFHNPTAASIDMSGWYVSGSKNNPRKFRIPDGSVIEPNGYLAFYRYQFQSFPNLPTAFGLNSAHGESVWLFEADRDDKLTGYQTGWEFPAAANAVPFIRHLSSIGPQISYESRQTFGSSVRGSDPEDLLSTFRRGRGAPNALPLMDTMVISEIKHQPLGTSFELRNVFEEYLELRSIVATNVALYDLAFTSNTWRVAGDVEYQFPTGVVVPPHGAVVLVAFDPKDGLLATEFRRQRGVPADALLFGPYEGMLHGGISLVELERPDIPQFCFDPDFGWTPYLVADHVAYSSTAPWPAAAAFPEFSLQRRVLQGFGNDPVHWMAGVPSTGAPNGAPAGPVPNSTLPSEQSVAPGGTLTLSASESASGQFFQWSFNGIPIAGANQPIFQISSASDEHTGVYGVLSSTAYGAAYQTIRVTVQTRPVVTAHPVSRTVARGGSAVFHASARGAGPYLYQWFKNGAVLTARTNVALHLTGVSSSDVGTYAVRISNAFGEVTTSQATLTLLAGQPPVFVEAPKGVFFRLDTPIPAGGSYELSSVVSGDQPIRYQWQRNEVDIPNATSPSHRLSRFQASDAGFYRLIAQNHLGSVTSAPVKVILLQPPGVTIDTTPVVVDEGGILRLRALATGTPRLYYQWQVDGRNINASFCSTLELPDMRTSDAGCYRVVVRNAAGTIVSETVEVQVRPRILQLSYRNRNATLNFRATPGKVYGVYGSTNLIHWDLLAIVPGIQEQVTVVHTNAPPVICLYKVREL